MKCPLRRRLKIFKERSSFILLGSELKAKRPQFLKVRPQRTRFVLFWVNIYPLPSVIIVHVTVYFKIVFFKYVGTKFRKHLYTKIHLCIFRSVSKTGQFTIFRAVLSLF